MSESLIKTTQNQNLSCCPICSGSKQTYLFEIDKFSITSCDGCGLTFTSPSTLPHPRDRFSIHPEKNGSALLKGKTEIEAGKKYLKMLTENFNDIHNILLIAEPGHCFAAMAKDFRFTIVQHLSVDEMEKVIDLPQALDAVVIIYQLEKSNSIEKILDKIYAALKPGGRLFMTTLSLDSRSARFFRQSWTGWRPENRYYFDDIIIQSLLLRYGFNEIQIESDLRWYSIAHINARAIGFPKTWVTRIIRLFYRILPSFLHTLYFRLPSSGIIVTAKKTPRRERPLLSIVVPVYNESSTFPVLIEQLVAKQIEGVDKEIIIIESNSTDNSRQLVLEYKDHPTVRIILQDKARGKGNAVREGFNHAQGDIVLIQDADLEYDLSDYEALLEPILTFNKSFVLGSRHSGNWKMRHFSDQKQLSAYLNIGHILFTTLINLLYGQHMKDPFTMFKVFRRDCLYNIYFECDRFDFDHELVIKLIRKGYDPLEIPVNYSSRSFKEGKKVQMFRDPLTWVKAIFKYRFAKITIDS